MGASVMINAGWCYLRLGQFESLFDRPSIAIVFSIILTLPAFYLIGSYRMAFRSTGASVVPAIALACACDRICYATIILGCIRFCGRQVSLH